jgi:DnaJ-class molecular chaperone
MRSQESIIKAARKSTALPHAVCHACKGEGKRFSRIAGNKIIPCPECHGTGNPPKEG